MRNRHDKKYHYLFCKIERNGVSVTNAELKSLFEVFVLNTNLAFLTFLCNIDIKGFKN